jgi:hypothetical protein
LEVIVSLAWNSKKLLGLDSGGDARGRTRVEYHFLSWRELYDKSILTADRYSSGSAEWVIRSQGIDGFYTVRVISRPFYRLPQQLCLTFDCFEEVIRKTTPMGEFMSSGPPIERVALEFSALVSVFARTPLVPLGLRRANDVPIIETPYYYYPSPTDRGSIPPAYGFNSQEFVSLLTGFTKGSEDTTQAVLSALNFYQSALSLVTLNPSVAYTSLISAIECIAGYHYYDRPYNFEELQKFKGAGRVMDRISKVPGTESLVTELKKELVRVERFVGNKFVTFFEEFLPDQFWAMPDELYPYPPLFPPINRENVMLCLKSAYEARSKFVHEGQPFPSYVDFGVRAHSSTDILPEVASLKDKRRFVPPLAWFERITHAVIVEYMYRYIAPTIGQVRDAHIAEKNQILHIIEELQPNVQESLERLTRWTCGFLGFALVNPYASNRDWADSAETVSILKDAGIIDGTGDGLEGSSWLKDRDVGEAVGEFIFGTEENPLRGNELLLPKTT